MPKLVGACFVAAVIVSSGGCSKLLDKLVAPETQTGEAFCGTLPRVNGALFFCGTVQGNLQSVPAPNQGYCMAAAANNLGLVGYSATTFNGGADAVRNQADATETCNLLNVGGNRQCGSVIRCTRVQ